MFDVSFPELLVIFVVALVVLGPTRLPGLVAKVGRWVGKARTMARQFREQLENEINLEELNRMTEAQTKAAKTPPPPPGFNGDPFPAAPPTPAATGDAPIPLATQATEYSGASTGVPGEDSFSHAHAADAPPMADVFPTDPGAPEQASLDLDPVSSSTGHWNEHK